MFNKEKYSESIRKLRKKANLTQYELSYLIDVDHSSFNKIELGQRDPTLKAIINLTNYFGISITDCLEDVASIEKRFFLNQIISMVDQIDNEDELSFLYESLVNFRKKGSK